MPTMIILLLKNSMMELMEFHDFPGCVGTLVKIYTCIKIPKNVNNSLGILWKKSTAKLNMIFVKKNCNSVAVKQIHCALTNRLMERCRGRRPLWSAILISPFRSSIASTVSWLLYWMAVSNAVVRFRRLRPPYSNTWFTLTRCVTTKYRKIAGSGNDAASSSGISVWSEVRRGISDTRKSRIALRSRNCFTSISLTFSMSLYSIAAIR